MGNAELTVLEPGSVQVESRYLLGEELGRGGMAVVYQALDLVNNQNIALKRLEIAANSPNYARAAGLFESEFVTLTRLAHPRIVAVHDFGYDNGRPFYTQELLTGGDLHGGAPMPWREVCRLLADVCSALSLLHSRRMVHRDITPRNIRCTEDGRAKLIDFGALAPFGVNKHVVGTPPCVAPEALGNQEIDGRVDLYGLGASAYFALTGRHAYPARHFSQLHGIWRSRPRLPSRCVEGVPAAVDELIMELLQLAPMARPRSAAEVMERLFAIADVDPGEQALVPLSYLNAPNLFGRGGPRTRIRKALRRAKQDRGSSIMIAGEAGTGRTRFLDSAVLEAKLAGFRVVRSDSGDGCAGPWGAARSISEQLLLAYPKSAQEAMGEHAPFLAEVLPQLRQKLTREGYEVSCPEFTTPQARRGALLEAFQGWILRLSRETPLVMAIDDLANLDDGSDALIASLAHGARSEALLVLATGDRLVHDSTVNPLGLFEESGATLILRNLSRGNSDKLLASVFGDVPNLHILSQPLFEIAGGNPKATMALAQHLLDEGVVRYEAGAWSLPARLNSEQFPTSDSALLDARLRRLHSRPRALVESIALASCEALSLAECRGLGAHQDDQQLLGDLATLVEAGILNSVEGKHGVTNRTTRNGIASLADPRRAAQIHASLARMFELCRNDAFRAATHAWLAGDKVAALEFLFTYAELVEAQRTDTLTAFERVRSLPEGWQKTARAIIEFAQTCPLSQAARHQLQVCLLADGVLSGNSPIEALNAILPQLHHDAGLDIYEQDTSSADASEKLKFALQAAQARFDGSSDQERVFGPGDAIPRLASAIIAAIGISVRGYDYALLAQAPRLGPLVALAPALKMVDMNQEACLHLLAGSATKARAIYSELLSFMKQTEEGGHDLSVFTYMKLAIQYAMGTLDAYAGNPSGADWAQKIEHNPSFAVNARRLRMLSCECQGDWRGAEDFRVELELLQVKNCPPQIFEGSHTFSHLQACVAARDLVGVKQTIPALEAMASELPTWLPMAALGRGAHHLLRGNATEALGEFDSALELVTAGEHVAWQTLCGARIEALTTLGDLETAIEDGRSALERGVALGVCTAVHHVGQPLAIACALSSFKDEAQGLADASIHARLNDGASGLLLGCAYETRARVAAILDDEAAFVSNSKLCGHEYRLGRNPVLSAKFERLMHYSRRFHPDVADDLAEAAEFTAQELPGILTGFGPALTQCRGPAERAQEILNVMVKQSKGRGGFLYVAHAGGLELRAQVGAVDTPPELDQCVRQYAIAQGGAGENATATADGGEEDSEDIKWPRVDGELLVPTLLYHVEEGIFHLTGLAVVQPARDAPLSGIESLVFVASRALRDAGDATTEFVQ